MERDVLARVQRLDDLIYQLGHCLARARNTTIGNGNRVKFEAACRGSSRFASQGEFRLFGGLQKRDDNLDTSLTPTARLIIEPLCAAGPGNNTKSSAPRPSDPENLRSHLVSPSPAEAVPLAEERRHRRPVRATPRFGDARRASAVWPRLQRSRRTRPQ